MPTAPVKVKTGRGLSALLRAVTLRLDRRPRNASINRTGALRPQLPHEAVRGNAPRMALGKVGSQPEPPARGATVGGETPRPAWPFAGTWRNHEGRMKPSSSCLRARMPRPIACRSTRPLTSSIRRRAKKKGAGAPSERDARLRRHAAAAGSIAPLPLTLPQGAENTTPAPKALHAARAWSYLSCGDPPARKSHVSDYADAPAAAVQPSVQAPTKGAFAGGRPSPHGGER
jgi:hypothetical protein